MNEELNKKIEEQIKTSDKHIAEWWEDWWRKEPAPEKRRPSRRPSTPFQAKIADLPPEFLFLHEAVFMDGEVVENIDPDIVKKKGKPKNWWEPDNSWSEYFEYGGDMTLNPWDEYDIGSPKSCDDRVNDLLETWKKLSGDFLDKA